MMTSSFTRITFGSATRIAIAAFIGLGLSTHAQARGRVPFPATSLPIVGKGPAKPIAAAVVFCTEHPEECQVDLTETDRITLTRPIWDQILRVNEAVNQRITAQSDKEHWGVIDRWNLPDDGKGDCEDFQLLKRHLLAASGLPRRSLRMAVVIDEMDEGHAVLIARTDRGDLILDNKTDAVLPWLDTGYRFMKMESIDGPGWTQIESAPAPVATAQP